MLTKQTQRIYPFTAIVGQDAMRLALILNAIEPKIGGVLIQGERGTAKSTAVRALAHLLPHTKVIQGCRFRCDPAQPLSWCPECKERFVSILNPPFEELPTAFVDLPVSATEDRVVGTLDIEKAIRSGERAFQPGVLANANRGVLYLDEVNLVDDHVVDLLLDAAAMGVNIVEREGISFVHPSRFVLVGTMNPEEGTLRPQLLDRFGLSVLVEGITDINQRILILKRVLDFESDPNRFMQTWEIREKELTKQIARARTILPLVNHQKTDREMIAEISCNMGVDGNRADLVMLKTAKAHAAYQNRRKIERQDIQIAAQLTIPHRLKRKPFETSLEIPAITEQVQNLVYPERKARLEEILNDYVDPITLADHHNECGFYVGG